MAIARGLLGILILVGLAFLLSENKRRINWPLVGFGLLLQALIAALILWVPGVQWVFAQVSGFIIKILGFSQAGSIFVFGDLANAERSGFIFAFQVLPTIVFFSALTSVLYYLGILQRFVYAFAWLMNRLMGLSGSESLAAAGNVFLGQTETPLLIKPYLEGMTRSEMMALMCGGMATIAGAVMAVYIGLLGGTDPDSQRAFAKLLLCASLMNAPASLVMAKLLVPQSRVVRREMLIDRSRAGANLLDALAGGSTQGLKLALNVAAMILVFLAMVELLNWPLVELGRWTGLDAWIAQHSGGVFTSFNLQSVVGYLFSPLAWTIGISQGDVLQVGQLLGMKMITNELIAFEQLAGFKESAGALSERSVFVATFALCGFANLGSIGIQLGGIGVLAPGQRTLLAELGFKAMLGGTFASLLSASVAGMFFGEGTTLALLIDLSPRVA